MELLPDPYRDRAVPTLEPPPNKPITIDKMYPNGGGKHYFYTKISPTGSS
jgi:hypothetical protein